MESNTTADNTTTMSKRCRTLVERAGTDLASFAKKLRNPDELSSGDLDDMAVEIEGIAIELREAAAEVEKLEGVSFAPECDR